MSLTLTTCLSHKEELAWYDLHRVLEIKMFEELHGYLVNVELVPSGFTDTANPYAENFEAEFLPQIRIKLSLLG